MQANMVYINGKEHDLNILCFPIKFTYDELVEEYSQKMKEYAVTLSREKRDNSSGCLARFVVRSCLKNFQKRFENLWPEKKDALEVYLRIQNVSSLVFGHKFELELEELVNAERELLQKPRDSDI